MIALDLETFQQSRKSANVTGVIYLELQDGAFPGRGWSDFPVIILGWWADALLQLELPTRRKVQWKFMDGPYSATLTKVGYGFPTGAFELPEVQTSLLTTSERVVARCDQQRMFSSDLEMLRSNLQQLKTKTMQRTEVSRSSHVEIRASRAGGSRR
jgi:hypothetical protein